MIKVDEKRQKLLTYIGITDKDLLFLKEQKQYFDAITPKVVDELYADIFKQPELAKIIRKYSTVDRLKQTQMWYFSTMVEGRIDKEFIDRRLYIGRLHSKIGLTTEWYLGTYMLYLDIAVQNFQKVAPDHWMEIILALSKMFNFDSQLVLEAYEYEEKQKIQVLSDERKSILERVNSAVQQLVTMITELSQSSQSVAHTAASTSELQDKALNRISELHSKINEISEVGELLQDISDQTNLIGLNATIEAAHAGDLGRGFGVVANEIRKLATHSKDSLKTIKTKLTEILQMLDDVMDDSEQTSKYAREQASRSQELTSFVNMIDALTRELEQIQ